MGHRQKATWGSKKFCQRGLPEWKEHDLNKWNRPSDSHGQKEKCRQPAMGAHMRSPHEKFILMLLGVSVRDSHPLGSLCAFGEPPNPPRRGSFEFVQVERRVMQDKIGNQNAKPFLPLPPTSPNAIYLWRRWRKQEQGYRVPSPFLLQTSHAPQD